jgi:hypothetical protein
MQALIMIMFMISVLKLQKLELALLVTTMIKVMRPAQFVWKILMRALLKKILQPRTAVTHFACLVF